MKGISLKQQRAIIALLEQPSIQKAAAHVGIGETTLYRWLADDDFKKALQSAKQRIVGHAITRIQNASGIAVDALVEILKNSDSPPSTKVSAARTILEMVNKFVEIEDLQARMDEIERRLKRQDEH